MNVSADPLASSPAFHFFQGAALVVKHRLIGLKQGAILVQDNDMLRKEIYELSQFTFVLSKFIFSLLPILDVRARRVPANNFSTLIN